MKIEKYTADYKSLWDQFIQNARNTHFFFKRDYMEYHSDRFEDNSLLVFNDSHKLVAVLPANIDNHILYTHQGLTFGGFIVDDKMKTEMMLTIFKDLTSFLKREKVHALIYKCMPYIYHTKPSAEDSYALFRNGATLIRRDVSSTIDLRAPVRYSKGRKWSINKAKKENLTIYPSEDLLDFWLVLTNVLEDTHNTSPVHTLEEMQYLMKKFPDNIKLYLIKDQEKTLSGALIYENENIIHTQYLASNVNGREIGALDMLIDHLIKDIYKEKHYFDFGISNENAGKILNTGLIAQKEGFGARPVVQDFYQLELK